MRFPPSLVLFVARLFAASEMFFVQAADMERICSCVFFCPAEEKPDVKATAEEEEQWAESKCWLGGVAALLLSYAVLSVDWLGDWDDWDDDDED